MPIKTQGDLPAKEILENENIFVMDESRAIHQDIRPLQVCILNLMPLKEDTELQLLRALSNTPLQVDITFLTVKSHESQNVSANHLNKFYTTFEYIKDQKFDGMIITGAPIEHLDYETVDYWEELCQIMDWTKTNVNRKVPLVRGFDDVFYAPNSRHTAILTEDIENCPDLKVLAKSEEAGVFLCLSNEGKQIFVMGHPEYDRITLDKEYHRDLEKGLPIDLPYNYYPNDDATKRPLLQWRANSNNLFSNWLNYYVYQVTPYEL